VDGWGKDWYVVSRNNKTVAKCPSKKWANKIAKLLIEAEAEKRERVIANRVDRCQQVLVDEVEHVRLDGYEHYLAHSLLEAVVEGYES